MDPFLRIVSMQKYLSKKLSRFKLTNDCILDTRIDKHKIKGMAKTYFNELLKS